MCVNLRSAFYWFLSRRDRLNHRHWRAEKPVPQGRENGSVGRKPRRFWSVRSSVTPPPAPGLSHTLPDHKYCIGAQLDWAMHKRGYWRPTRVGGGSECGLLALTWDAKSYNTGSLKTCVRRLSHKPQVTLIGGQRMAQTRRMGKRNQRACRPKAPRFSPYRGQDHADLFTLNFVIPRVNTAAGSRGPHMSRS
jgi:hypothetical protein